MLFRSDAMKKLPNRNPFNKVNIRRKQKGVLTEASHRPLEPNMIHAVMQSAAIAGQDIFDLFTVALYTGMRLKDAALLEWKSVGNDFLCIAPYKTLRFGTIAKVPISGDLRGTLSRRLKERDFNQYVNPVMAMLYREDDGHKICKKSQKIFVQALGKENTIIPKGEHRKIDSSIYSFESFRTTFATLLGYNNTEYRTVMEMMGWNSWNMLKVYEKKYQFNSRSRDLEKIRSVEKLGILSSCIAGIVPVAPKLQPTKEALEKLLPTYSNVAIGRIYGISDVAIGNWLDKFGLVREKRIESPDLSEAEIQRIREELQAA